MIAVGTRCAPAPLRKGIRCVIARLNQQPHIQVAFRLGQPDVYDCRRGVPRVPGQRPVPCVPQPRDSTDSATAPDFEGPICAGVQRDPFPSAVVYVLASFVDPNARHYDTVKKAYVVGPVTSKLYYQFAGIRQLPKR